MSDEFKTGFYSDKACAVFELLICFGKNYSYLSRNSDQAYRLLNNMQFSSAMLRTFKNIYVIRNPDNEIVLKELNKDYWACRTYISEHDDEHCRSYFAWRLNDAIRAEYGNGEMPESAIGANLKLFKCANDFRVKSDILQPNECFTECTDFVIDYPTVRLMVDILLRKRNNIKRAIRKYGQKFYDDLVGKQSDPFTAEQETVRRETIDKINGKLKATITELENKKRDEYTKFMSELEAKYKVLMAEARISAENEIRQLNNDILGAINAAKEEAAKIAEGSTDKAAEDLVPVTSLSIDL